MPDTATIERELDRLAESAHAGLIRRELTKRLTKRVEIVLADACSRLHAGTLPAEDAKAAIAAITHLRLLLSDLSAEERRVQQARERIAPSPSGDSARRL